MGEALGLGLLLLWLLGRKAEEVPETPTSSGTSSDHTTPTTNEGGGPGAGLTGALISGAGLVIKLISGGAPAGAAAGAAPLVGGTAAAGAALGPVMVLLLANPVAWAIYILIGTIISRHQSESKNFEMAVWRLGANARNLHEYERQLFEEYDRNTAGDFAKTEVRDGRLDYAYNHDGHRVTFQGWRTVVTAPGNTSSSTGNLRDASAASGTLHAVARRIRAAALVYLQARAVMGLAIFYSERFNRKEVPEGYMLDAFALTRLHESMEPGLGGLSQVPLIDGQTLAPRTEVQNPFPPIAQLIGKNTEPDTDGLTMEDVYAANLAALLDVVCLFRFDLNIDLRGPGEWADALYVWIGQPSGVSRSGRTWTLDPAVFGAPYVLDVWAAKTNTGRILAAPGADGRAA